MVSTKVGDRLGSPCDDSPLFYIQEKANFFDEILHQLFNFLAFGSFSFLFPILIFSGIILMDKSEVL
jgi:hypothetical protein